MEMMAALLLAALLQQPLAGDDEAEAAVKAFKAEYPKHGIEAHIAAVAELLKLVHEKTIKALAEPLAGDAEAVRLAIAKELGDVDHPAAVEVLVGAIPKNLNRPEVLDAICDALGDLGWQTAAGPLQELVRRVADPDVRASLPSAIRALGQLGSPGSVDVLADLLIKIQGPRRNPWPNEGAMAKAADTALKSITGFDFKKGQDWMDWWKAHQGELLPTAKRTYWSRKTHERTIVDPGQKAPDDSILVATRIMEAAANPAAPAKKKKKKDK